jgi:hypothetical protein
MRTLQLACWRYAGAFDAIQMCALQRKTAAKRDKSRNLSKAPASLVPYEETPCSCDGGAWNRCGVTSRNRCACRYRTADPGAASCYQPSGSAGGGASRAGGGSPARALSPGLCAGVLRTACILSAAGRGSTAGVRSSRGAKARCLSQRVCWSRPSSSSSWPSPWAPLKGRASRRSTERVHEQSRGESFGSVSV